MNERAITCIGCPMGCRLRVQLDGGAVTVVDGAACGRGTAYARQECVNPTRVLTTLVRVRGRSAPLSVKTARPVPKEKLFACLEELRHIQVEGPVHIGDVVLRDVCGTGVDIVATMELGVGGGGTR